ncbi:MAG TPA: hypothetical protein ENN67_06870, partial [Firmicutes bacterium]|nr:hypothetical protein [Bacillota bacterium]
MSGKNEHNQLSMCEFLTGVADYLTELTEANRDLLVALKKYQQLLINGNPVEIERETPALDRLTGKIRILDEKRRLYV